MGKQRHSKKAGASVRFPNKGVKMKGGRMGGKGGKKEWTSRGGRKRQKTTEHRRYVQTVGRKKRGRKGTNQRRRNVLVGS